MIYTKYPFITIEVSEKDSVIIMTWQGTFTSGQYREAVEFCWQLVENNKLKYWLANTKHIDEIKPNDQQWTSAMLMPRLSAFGVKKVAIVIPESVYNHFAISNVMALAKDDITFITKYFVYKEEALTWFKESVATIK